MLMGIGNLYQIPMIYQGIKDWRAAAVGSPLPYTMVCALVVFVSLCGGGLVYAFHLPERWCKPGRFNLVRKHLRYSGHLKLFSGGLARHQLCDQGG